MNWLAILYAVDGEHSLPSDFILDELDKAGNESMRNGFYIGKFNQRGVYHIDSEENGDRVLAQKYSDMADVVERKGFSRIAETLRSLEKDYAHSGKDGDRK